MEKRTKIKKLGWALALALSLYVLGLQGTQRISRINSPKIRSQSQLEEQLLRERERLGMNGKIVINTKIGNNSYTTKIRDNEYELNLKKNASLSTLRHELYHIYDGHCDTKHLTKLPYLFWYEPQATIYEATGLKP